MAQLPARHVPLSRTLFGRLLAPFRRKPDPIPESGWLGLRASDLNLVTAVLVGIALMLPGVANPLRGLFKRSAP